MMIIGDIKHYDCLTFFHLRYHKGGSSVTNFQQEMHTFKGRLTWQLRFGGVDDGEIILNNYCFDNPPITSLSKQPKSFYVEQYLPPDEGIIFTRKCMSIIERLLQIKKEEGRIVGMEEFQKIINEVRDDKSI